MPFFDEDMRYIACSQWRMGTKQAVAIAYSVARKSKGKKRK